MISSTAGVFLHFLATYQGENKWSNHYIVACILALIDMVALMLAFMTGLYVVPPSAGLTMFICAICSLSLAIFMVIFGKSYYDLHQDYKKKYL